jgi:hypothetical protein
MVGGMDATIWLSVDANSLKLWKSYREIKPHPNIMCGVNWFRLVQFYRRHAICTVGTQYGLNFPDRPKAVAKSYDVHFLGGDSNQFIRESVVFSES